MNKLVQWWRRLWHQELVIGHPDYSSTWVKSAYGNENFMLNYPPFDIGRLVLTGTGFRVLLFRWLVLINPLDIMSDSDMLYQPLFWLEYVATGQVDQSVHRQHFHGIQGRHFLFQFVMPPDRGQLMIVLPLSILAIKEFGLIHIEYDKWGQRQLNDGITE